MRTLKDLTKDECVKIASIGEPNVEWKFVQSSCKWDGFDLIEKDCEDEIISKFIFQIDYRSDEEIFIKSRFRFYEDLKEYTPDVNGILNYLNSIGCTLT